MKHCLLILLFLFYTTNSISDDGVDSSKNTVIHHADSSERLRFIMLKLNSAFKSGIHTDVHNEKIINGSMEELIEAIENLLRISQTMTADAPSFNLNTNQEETFRSISNQLYVDALYLKQATKSYDYSLIDEAYQRLNQNCVNCHNLFRHQ
jgi:hypothetical protein